MLYTGFGHYKNAGAAAETASAYLPKVNPFSELGSGRVGRAVRVPERAADTLWRLSESTSASGSDWALWVQVRSRALLSEGETADRPYREAIQRLGRTRMRVDQARRRISTTGEWLRPENRRIDAGEHLRVAHEMLTEIGLDGFADRARHELLVTGESVRKRTVDTLTELTAQESQIAKLARDGAPTRRSAAACSSAPAPSSGIWATSSASSASPRVKTFADAVSRSR